MSIIVSIIISSSSIDTINTLIILPLTLLLITSTAKRARRGGPASGEQRERCAEGARPP